MAFLTKFGNFLKQTAIRNINTELSASRPSIFRAIRCISTSKSLAYGNLMKARGHILGHSRGFGSVTEGAFKSVRGEREGTGWICAATDSIESLLKIQTGIFPNLSIEKTREEMGDKGGKGKVTDVFEHFIKCGIITGYKVVSPFDERALMAAVTQQPVVVGIDARSPEFVFYRCTDPEEVLSFTSPHSPALSISHFMLLAGYGQNKDGKPFWLLKNCWGPSWGHKGYVKLERGIKDPRGTLGILTFAVFPTSLQLVS